MTISKHRKILTLSLSTAHKLIYLLLMKLGSCFAFGLNVHMLRILYLLKICNQYLVTSKKATIYIERGDCVNQAFMVK